MSKPGPLFEVQSRTGAPERAWKFSASSGFRDWMRAQDIGLAFSTYHAGAVIALGAGRGDLSVQTETFASATALLGTTRGLYLSAADEVWRFESASGHRPSARESDPLYLPQQSWTTGDINIHDLAIDRAGRLVAVATLLNSIVSLESDGEVTPLWRPAFITALVDEDRCHLNGFCLEDGHPAYATLVGPSNVRKGWRSHTARGGQVIDVRCDEVVATGLAMPTAPRLYRQKLWLLESGSGWFGTIDLDRGGFERVLWLPGFLRGLRCIGDYAIIGTSTSRDSLFRGLPLQDELTWRGAWPMVGLHVVNLVTGKLEHRLEITGLQEVYDIAILPGAGAPRLAGIAPERVAV